MIKEGSILISLCCKYFSLRKWAIWVMIAVPMNMTKGPFVVLHIICFQIFHVLWHVALV